MYCVYSEAGRLLMLTNNEDETNNVDGIKVKCLENEKAILIPQGVQIATVIYKPDSFRKLIVTPPTLLRAAKDVFGNARVINGSMLMDYYNLDKYEDLQNVNIEF